MKKKLLTLIVVIISLLVCDVKVFSQNTGNNISSFTTNVSKPIKLDTREYSSYELRLYLVYQLYKTPNIDLSLDNTSGVFNININSRGILNNNEYITNIYDKILDEYAQLSKDSIGELFHQYKSLLPSEYTNHILAPTSKTRSSTNNLAANALPFCTDNGLYNFPAGVNAGSGEYGPDYSCLSSQPNPAWYYMKIDNPGDINIYMYSTPLVDIDFCCWGPFSDPVSPCPYGLTSGKVVSCSYSTDPTETCEIPSSAQSGEYYILLITNYSNMECNISFEKQSGIGTTDCSIMPPMLESNSPLCIGDTLFLKAQESGNASYSWTGPNGWTSNLRNPFITNVTLDMQGDYSCCVSVEGQTSDPMTTEVLIGHPYDTLIVDTICQGNNYLFNGFNIINPNAGFYYDTLYLNSIYGCDSIVKLELTVNSPYDTLIVDTICYGNDYIENGFNFIKPNPGNYSETLYLNTINGCDSIVTLNLTVNQSFSTTLYDEICVYEEYNKYGFELKDLTAGEYTFQQNLTTTNGCDSTIYLDLNVIRTYDDLTIDGLEDVLVSSDLITGYYKYTCNLYDDCYQYNWSISNQEWHIYPNLNECTVLVTSPIKNALTVSAENYCGIFYDTIDLNAEFITFEENNKKEVSAFPNPAKDFINIQYKDIIRINIYNSQGHLVLRQDYNYKNKVHLDLSSLKNSIYIMEVITADKTISKRISIIK